MGRLQRRRPAPLPRVKRSAVQSTIDALIRRDGFGCYWCQELVYESERTREHLIPRAAGGSGHISNLVMACRTCNNLRADVPAAIWEAAINEVRERHPGKHPAKLARQLIMERGLWFRGHRESG